MLLNAGPSELLGQTLPEFNFVDFRASRGAAARWQARRR